MQTAQPGRVVGPGFRERVYAVVQRVPPGFVSTYGDVAAALGSAKVARQVGFALAALPQTRGDVPWHRIINAQGRMSFRGDDVRGELQLAMLQAEGVLFEPSGRVRDFARRRFVHPAPPSPDP